MLAAPPSILPVPKACPSGPAKFGCAALFFALVCLCFLFSDGLAAASPPAGLPWLSYEQARVAGRAGDKPLLIYFHAPWCYFCKKMKRETFRDKQVMKVVPEKMLLVSVDVNQQPRVGEVYKIDHVPMMVFLNPGGQPVLRLAGYVSADKLLRAARYMSGGHYKNTPFDQFD